MSEDNLWTVVEYVQLLRLALNSFERAEAATEPQTLPEWSDRWEARFMFPAPVVEDIPHD